ncbi:MAG: hypothetical protein FJY36_06125 [Betaproteobacteria bacterium]|nr:hypothetical protein [Betaproteobacteria bacterium]
MRLKVDDLAQTGGLSSRPMIGLRYGRWRLGSVDGATWYRFGQMRTDNTLTYDWLDTRLWRTSLSASVVNLEKDSPTDLFESGRKTLRGKATIDYIGWPHWGAGLMVTQDLLDRGAGTTFSPSITYRQALTEDSTLLLSQSATWVRFDRTPLAPGSSGHQGRGWASTDSAITLRQRWKPQWSWYAQLNRSQAIGSAHPVTDAGRTTWSAQAGVIHFSP